MRNEYDLELIRQLNDTELKIIYGRCIHFKNCGEEDEKFIVKFLDNLYGNKTPNSNMSEIFIQDINHEMAERFFRRF